MGLTAREPHPLGASRINRSGDLSLARTLLDRMREELLRRPDGND
jgi:hypothetical protein